MAYKVLVRGHRHLNLARSATLKPSGINHGDMGGEKKGNINAMFDNTRPIGKIVELETLRLDRIAAKC